MKRDSRGRFVGKGGTQTASGGGGGAHFEVGVDVSEVLGILDDMAEVDLSPTMQAIAEMFVSEVQENFQTAGRGAWPPLAESTLRSRRGASAQILVDTGRLAASINASSGADYAEASTDVEYAVFHVSDAPRKKIPLRNFFELPPDVYERAAQQIVDAIVE